MKYCEKCYHLTEKERCPYCKNKKLTSPRDTDYCFLIEKEMIFSEMLIETLNNNKIIATYQTVLGAGIAMNLGPTFERYKIFVPYANLSKSNEILNEMFPE